MSGGQGDAKLFARVSRPRGFGFSVLAGRECHAGRKGMFWTVIVDWGDGKPFLEKKAFESE
jgi:hypothetical protein